MAIGEDNFSQLTLVGVKEEEGDVIVDEDSEEISQTGKHLPHPALRSRLGGNGGGDDNDQDQELTYILPLENEAPVPAPYPILPLENAAPVPAPFPVLNRILNTAFPCSGASGGPYFAAPGICAKNGKC